MKDRDLRKEERELKWRRFCNAFWAKIERLSPPGTDVEQLKTVYAIAMILSQVAMLITFVDVWGDAERHIEVYKIGEVFHSTGKLPGFLYLFYLLITSYFLFCNNATASQCLVPAKLSNGLTETTSYP